MDSRAVCVFKMTQITSKLVWTSPGTSRNLSRDEKKALPETHERVHAFETVNEYSVS